MMAMTQGADVSGNFVIHPPGAPAIWPALHCGGGQLLAPSHSAYCLVEGKNFLLIPDLATVELLGVLAGHMNQASE